MKIRKTEPSVGILGKIVNLFSNSTKDTYSCDYINQSQESLETVINTLTESQESLETVINTLTESINKAKKVVLTGQWINAVAAFGGGTMLTLPIYNPTGTKPDVSGITGQYYDESTTSWKDITTIQVGWASNSFIVLTLNTEVQKYGVLVQLYGTIQAQ